MGAVNNAFEVKSHVGSAEKFAVTSTGFPSETKPVSVTVCGLAVIEKD